VLGELVLGDLGVGRLVGGQLVVGRVVGFIVLGELSLGELSLGNLSAGELPLYLLSPFGTHILGSLVYIFRFGMLYQEKSGKPAANRCYVKNPIALIKTFFLKST
jgi:hypothetical protein